MVEAAPQVTQSKGGDPLGLQTTQHGRHPPQPSVLAVPRMRQNIPVSGLVMCCALCWAALPMSVSAPSRICPVPSPHIPPCLLLGTPTWHEVFAAPSVGAGLSAASASAGGRGPDTCTGRLGAIGPGHRRFKGDITRLRKAGRPWNSGVSGCPWSSRGLWISTPMGPRAHT